MVSKKAANNEVAVEYLGKALISVIIGIIICFLATIGYNTYISVTDKKIEVRATNSNTSNNID